MSKFKCLMGIIFFTLVLGMAGYAADRMTNPETSGGMQSPDSSAPGMSSDQKAGVININTASEDQLKMLPSIDDQLAKNIVSYRNSNGPFKSLDDLLNVKGMTKEKFNQVSQNLVLQGDSTYSAPAMPESNPPAAPESNPMNTPSTPGPTNQQ
jgi:competence ComEA-like helix-hairpin-helix protein